MARRKSEMRTWAADWLARLLLWGAVGATRVVGASEPPLLWSESVPWPLSGMPIALTLDPVTVPEVLTGSLPAEVTPAGFSLPWRSPSAKRDAQAAGPVRSLIASREGAGDPPLEGSVTRLDGTLATAAPEVELEGATPAGSQSVEQVFGDVLGDLGPELVAAVPVSPSDAIINPLREAGGRQPVPSNTTVESSTAPELPLAASPQPPAPGQLTLPSAVGALPAPTTTAPAPSGASVSLPTPNAPSQEIKAEKGGSPKKPTVAEKEKQPSDKTPTEGPRLAARVPVPAQVLSLREPLERCLKMHEQMRLNTRDDGAWSIMHSFLGWGPGTEVHVGGPRGQRVNAIHWITQNQPCMGRPLFYLSGDHLRGREGPGFQGHPAQFLAMLAQTGIDASYPIRVNGRDFTVADLVKEEQLTCRQDTELTFKLIGLSYYTPTDTKWKNEQGEAWDFSRVVQIELASPINGAACGGTHRLMGLTFSLAQRRKEGKPIEGQWWRADRYIHDYQRYIMTLQNSDGSFSSEWFKRRADRGDLDRRVQTTGHMLEWLVFSLPDEGLYQPHVLQAVHFLATTLTQHRFHEWEVGPKGHAARALRLYHTRVFAHGASPPMARRDGGEGVK